MGLSKLPALPALSTSDHTSNPGWGSQTWNQTKTPFPRSPVSSQGQSARPQNPGLTEALPPAAQPLPAGLPLPVGKSRPRLLAGSDPCPGLTRSLRMFLSSEVTPEQEVTPSHCLPVCWTHSQQASLRAQPCPLRGISAQGQNILQPLPPASQGRPCGSEAGTLPRKTARRCLRGGRRTTQRGAGVPGQLWMAGGHAHGPCRPCWPRNFVSGALGAMGGLGTGERCAWSWELGCRQSISSVFWKGLC